MERRVSLIVVGLLSLCLFFGGVSAAFADNGRAVGSDEKYWDVIKGSVVIQNTEPKNMKRHWVFVKCDHWAGCYMRCVGKLSICEKLADTVAWKEIYLFSDKPAPKARKEVKK